MLKIKRLELVFGILGLLLIPLYCLSGQKDHKITTVVIDAGHGGHDSGARNGKTLEKDINLAIALKTGKLIENSCNDVKVIYTRTTDVFVELYKRAKIANEAKADLFISIHCNSNPSAKSYGTESYVMGLHKSSANLQVAKMENSSILLENDYSAKYDGFDPNSPEANIIFTLFQNAFLEQSLDLASKIQTQLSEKTKLFNRGVKQAGFLVLYKTAMPGILVESGFISNDKDRLFLESNEGQSSIARSICSAFVRYKSECEKQFDDKQLAKKSSEVNPDEKSPKHKTKSHKKTSSSPETGEKSSANTSPSTTEPVIVANEPIRKTVKDTFPVQNNASKIDSLAAKEIEYRVQFATSDKEKPLNSKAFNGLEDVRKYFHQGLYKYTVGNKKTIKEAVALMKEMKKKGYKDAFVVAFLNNQRIALTADSKQ